MMMDIKKIEDRRWQIGAYDITLPADVEDTQEEAFKAALTSMHHGTHKFATTYRKGDRKWIVDGKTVVLHSDMDDTEEQARAMLEDSAKVIDPIEKPSVSRRR